MAKQLHSWNTDPKKFSRFTMIVDSNFYRNYKADAPSNVIVPRNWARTLVSVMPTTRRHSLVNSFNGM